MCGAILLAVEPLRGKEGFSGGEDIVWSSVLGRGMGGGDEAERVTVKPIDGLIAL